MHKKRSGALICQIRYSRAMCCKLNEPKCVNATFQRLIAEGFTEREAKEMIAAILLEKLLDQTAYNTGIFPEEENRGKMKTC